MKSIIKRFLARRKSDDKEARRKRKIADIGPWRKKQLNIWDVIDVTPDYIVFFDENFDLDYRFEHAIKDRARFNSQMNQAAFLETSIAPDLPWNIKMFCKRLIGEAIACSLEEDFDNARLMLDSAGTFVLARNREKSRIWYLSFCALFALPALAVGVAAWLTIHLKRYGYFGEGFLWLVACGAAGATGALLSVITRTGSLEFDAVAGRRLHAVESASRIATGVISGVIAGFAIKSGLALKSIYDNGASYLLLLSAFAAGAGERYVTSIISNVNSLGLRGRDSNIAGRAPTPLTQKAQGKKRQARPTSP